MTRGRLTRIRLKREVSGDRRKKQKRRQRGRGKQRLLVNKEAARWRDRGNKKKKKTTKEKIKATRRREIAQLGGGKGEVASLLNTNNNQGTIRIGPGASEKTGLISCEKRRTSDVMNL